MPNHRSRIKQNPETIAGISHDPVALARLAEELGPRSIDDGTSRVFVRRRSDGGGALMRVWKFDGYNVIDHSAPVIPVAPVPGWEPRR